jgi:hypothetical protein
MKYGACALATVLALLLAARPGDDNLDTIMLNGKDCGPSGEPSPEDPGGELGLNKHKNRWDLPGDDDLDPSVSMAAMIAPGWDKDRFDGAKAARIQGYVVDVKVGGVESCNCHAKKASERDTHIELAPKPNAPKKQVVIVEVTPRLRMLMKKKMDLDWSTDQIRADFKGKWVEVEGWVMFDVAHINEAENTHPGGGTNWRATCWEVHPVTRIKEIAAPDEAAAFQPTSFTALQRMHAAHVARTGRGDDALAKLREKALSKFSKAYLAEVEEEAKERRP